MKVVDFFIVLVYVKVDYVLVVKEDFLIGKVVDNLEVLIGEVVNFEIEDKEDQGVIVVTNREDEGVKEEDRYLVENYQQQEELILLSCYLS